MRLSRTGSFIRNARGSVKAAESRIRNIRNRSQTIPRLIYQPIGHRTQKGRPKIENDIGIYTEIGKKIPEKIPKIGKNPTRKSGSYVPTRTMEEPPLGAQQL